MQAHIHWHLETKCIEGNVNAFARLEFGCLWKVASDIGEEFNNQAMIPKVKRKQSLCLTRNTLINLFLIL